MKKEEAEKYFNELEFPIFTDEGRQLTFFKNGKEVECIDPVYSVSIDEENVNVVGYSRYIYSINLNDFDKVDDIYRIGK